MTEIENDKPKSDKSGKSGARDQKSRRDREKPKFLSKVVIRLLPPTMTEEDFINQIEPLPDHDQFYYVSADWSLGPCASCRAYITFRNEDDIYLFRDRFDGYVFVDKKGVEYPAVVEFAPFQGLPKNRSRKKDNKCNTIETDPDYIAFLEALVKSESTTGKTEQKMEYSFQLKDEKKIVSTPLLEYIANKKQERRDERKKKIEDRKKHREEERQRKKTQVAKAIPQSIREEEIKPDDDGIVVRTVKSRIMDRNQNTDTKRNQTSSTDRYENNRGGRDRQRDDDRRVEREKREAARRDERKKYREERDAKRREERERNRKERERERKEQYQNSDAPKKFNNKNEVETEESKMIEGNMEVAKEASGDKQQLKDDRVKKYSERRRERNANRSAAKTEVSEYVDAGHEQKPIEKQESFENRHEPTETKEIEDRNELMEVNEFDKKDETEPKIETNLPQTDIKHESSVSDSVQSRNDRSLRAIRNKDRPSLQIYQPKRRLEISSKKDEEKLTRTTSNSPTESKPNELVSVEKNDLNEKVNLEDVDSLKKIADRKVSRFSERRLKRGPRGDGCKDDADNEDFAGDNSGCKSQEATVIEKVDCKLEISSTTDNISEENTEFA